MTWINIKERVPDDSDPCVLIRLKRQYEYIFFAKFFDEFITLGKEYKNVFVVIPHPLFPKHWGFSDEYRKIAYITKDKVKYWMPVPDYPD